MKVSVLYETVSIKSYKYFFNEKKIFTYSFIHSSNASQKKGLVVSKFLVELSGKSQCFHQSWQAQMEARLDNEKWRK